MIILNKEETSESIIVTITESVTITNPYYLFVFTCVATREVTSFIKSYLDEQSLYTERFNEFLIDTSTIFDGKDLGQYQYQIYEQESDSNTDVTGLNLLERGKMILKEVEANIYTSDEPTTTYIV